ncbi:hypothetical protein EDD22DRAFT_255632 [Suillus occidentalis]|nr:hypothetical protein EDD22DRAFT_255632 [Suillus occidentalis]
MNGPWGSMITSHPLFTLANLLSLIKSVVLLGRMCYVRDACGVWEGNACREVGVRHGMDGVDGGRGEGGDKNERTHGLMKTRVRYVMMVELVGDRRRQDLVEWKGLGCRILCLRPGG